MKFIPHGYQKYAIGYIKTHPTAAVLLDMGLGKTVITLTAINDLIHDSFEIRKALIVAPLRVARDTWPSEIHKWDHLTDISYSVVIGNEAERLSALKTAADIYLINRENVQWLIDESGVPFDFDMLVIDELSSFKNHTAKRFKSLMKVRPKVKRIVGLTGTPASNGLMDLWAEFRLLDMGQRLGRFISNYRSEYFVPDKRNGMVVYSYKPLSGAEDRIYEAISDITVSMKAADYLKMPELISSEYRVKMDEYEKSKYDTIKKELVLEVGDSEITVANAAALSNKLLQMANGSFYADDGSILKLHTRKLDALEDIIESANGKPVLVAYWYKHDFTGITKRLTTIGVPYRSITHQGDIEEWNAGRVPVGLIHPASAGHGLNLQQGGNHLVWYGLTWSLELYRQTNARLFRQGQTADTVIVQHIITEGTIDERIMKALENKDKIQNALIDAVKAEVGI